MKNIIYKAVVCTCSVSIMSINFKLLQGILLGIAMFIIDFQYNLQYIHGGSFIVGCIYEIILVSVSTIAFYCNADSVLLIWICFSSINKFGIESPNRVSLLSKYYLLFGYSSSLVLFSLYVCYEHDLLFRYGLIALLVNMIVLALVFSSKEDQVPRDFDRLYLVLSIAINIIFCLVFKSKFALIPVAGVFLLQLLYDAVVAIARNK
jgi:hypothetical protein